MVKYILRNKGFGKYKYSSPESVSEKKAKELKSQGFKVFGSRSEAIKHKEKK